MDLFEDVRIDEDTSSDDASPHEENSLSFTEAQKHTEKKESGKRKTKQHRETNKPSVAEGTFRRDGGKEQDQKKDEKRFPNYLIAMQMTNPQIFAGIQRVQEDVISRHEGLKAALQPMGMLHLTMFMMHLATDDDFTRAKRALDQCKRELSRVFHDSVLSLDIAGVDNFRNKVVFASVKTQEQEARLKEIADVIEECFADQGIVSAAKHGGFAAHVTVLNLSRDKNSRKRGGIKKIEPDLYTDHIGDEFGRQYVNTLQLCPMQKPKTESGYYQVEHSVQFGPDIRDDVYD